VDQNYAQLQQQGQQTAALIQTPAGKLQAAAAQGYQRPQQGYQQRYQQPQYQQPQYQQQGGMLGGGGMLQSFLGGGLGRASVTGAGFGIGDDLVNKIF
jgi:L-amino acid N-acyltransferase YncA